MRRSFFKAVYWGSVVLLALSLTFCKKPGPAEPEDDPTEQTDPENPGTPGEETVLVSEIILTPDGDITLELQETVQLSAEILPENAADKAVNWESSAPEVATVDNTGLVKGVAVGKATIYVRSRDKGATAVKEVTVFEPLPNHFTRIEITAPNKEDTFHFYEDTPGIGTAYRFVQNEGFRFKAKGYPEGADDEIEFTCINPTPAFTISPDGYANMLAGCGAKTSSNPYAYQRFKIYARSKKYPTVRSEPVLVYIEGPEAQRAVLTPFMTPYPHVSPAKNDLRHTKYIGLGRIQDFTIHIERKSDTGVYSYSPSANFSIYDQTGDVTFETYTYDRYTVLRAKAPSNSQVSTASQPVQSTVTIQIGTYKRTLTFNLSELDPYMPKLGDGIAAKGEGLYDGGYRGNGLYEEIKYEVTPQTNAIIAWIGDTHLREDALYSEYCKGGLKGTGGKVTHGIAIPVRTSHLYRSSKTSGEVFSDDRDNLKSSDALPSWFTNKDLLNWSTGYKMTAFTNTCALVYRNRKCGSSHDVKPINFFVDEETLQPTVDKGTTNDEKNVKVGDFSWESDFYGSYDTGNLKSSSDSFSCRAYWDDGNPVLSPWLMPSLSDLYYIFAGERPAVDFIYRNINYEWVMTGNTISVKDRMTILLNGITRLIFPKVSPSSYEYSYWTCQQNQAYFAPVFTISDNKASVSLEDKTSNRAYVLPIAYF